MPGQTILGYASCFSVVILDMRDTLSVGTDNAFSSIKTANVCAFLVWATMGIVKS